MSLLGPCIKNFAGSRCRRQWRFETQNARTKLSFPAPRTEWRLCWWHHGNGLHGDFPEQTTADIMNVAPFRLHCN